MQICIANKNHIFFWLFGQSNYYSAYFMWFTHICGFHSDHREQFSTKIIKIKMKVPKNIWAPQPTVSAMAADQRHLETIVSHLAGGNRDGRSGDRDVIPFMFSGVISNGWCIYRALVKWLRVRVRERLSESPTIRCIHTYIYIYRYIPENVNNMP